MHYYRNYRIIAGTQYGHTIDPDTASPANTDLVAVTVLMPATSSADALATALMVMGGQQAHEFCERHEIPALLRVRAS